MQYSKAHSTEVIMQAYTTNIWNLIVITENMCQRVMVIFKDCLPFPIKYKS